MHKYHIWSNGNAIDSRTSVAVSNTVNGYIETSMREWETSTREWETSMREWETSMREWETSMRNEKQVWGNEKPRPMKNMCVYGRNIVSKKSRRPFLFNYLDLLFHTFVIISMIFMHLHSLVPSLVFKYWYIS